MENRSLEVEKIKFWPSNCPISTEYLWLAPFILLLQVKSINNKKLLLEVNLVIK